MPAMPGSQGAVRRGLHTADDEVRADFQGEAAGAGELPGVQEGLSKGVTGDEPPNPARSDKRGVGEGGS